MARAMCRGVDIDGLLARARRHGHLVLGDAPATVPAHHCMLVPLAARGRVLGALGLVVPAESHTYEAADLTLARQEATAEIRVRPGRFEVDAVALAARRDGEAFGAGQL